MKYIDRVKQENNAMHALCDLFCERGTRSEMLDSVYNRGLMEYEELKNRAGIVHEPSFARRVMSPAYWAAVDRLNAPEEEKDYGGQQMVFLCVTGGGIGAVLILSLVLGIRKCMTHKEEEVVENEQLNIDAHDDY